MKKTTWELTQIGSKRLLQGIWVASLMSVCIAAVACIVTKLINLLATEPVQLLEPVSSGIRACKMAMIIWAFLVGLGKPE